MGIILYPIAYVLNFVFTPFVMLYSFIKLRNLEQINLYFKAIDLAIDIKGNIVAQYFLNDLLITKDGYKFGGEGFTISNTLSINQKSNTLTKIGKFIVAILIKLKDPAFKQ